LTRQYRVREIECKSWRKPWYCFIFLPVIQRRFACSPPASFDQIHAVFVSSFTIRKGSSLSILIKCNFCNFLFWIPPFLDPQGRRPVRPLCTLLRGMQGCTAWRRSYFFHTVRNLSAHIPNIFMPRNFHICGVAVVFQTSIRISFLAH